MYCFLAVTDWCLCTQPPLPPPLQLTSSLLLQFLGNSTAAVAKRAQYAANAKAIASSQLRCESLPAFVQSVQTLARNGFPAWYSAAFFSTEPVQY